MFRVITLHSLCFSSERREQFLLLLKVYEGTPVIFLSNPSKDHTWSPQCPLSPFYQKLPFTTARLKLWAPLRERVQILKEGKLGLQKTGDLTSAVPMFSGNSSAIAPKCSLKPASTGMIHSAGLQPPAHIVFWKDLPWPWTWPPELWF